MKSSLIICIKVFLFLFVTEYCIAQNSFERRYNSFNESTQGIACQILSTGYGVLSNINTSGPGPIYMEYLHLDPFGNIISIKNYNITTDGWSYLLLKSIGDTLIVSGRTANPFQHIYDIFLKKIDINGNLIWEKQFPSDTLFHDVIPISICNTIDSGYFVLFQSINDGIKFFKLNSDGDSLFSKKIGTPFIGGSSMSELHDSGFALLGVNNLGYSIIRLNPNGDSLWSRSYSGVGIGVISRIVETKDHGFVVLGNLNDSLNHNPTCLFRFDSIGTFLWSKPFYTSNIQDFREVRNCLDNGFIVSGVTMDPAHNFSYGFLYRTDSNGDSLWFKEYETTFNSGFGNVQQTPDNGFLAVGSIQGALPGHPPDLFVVKTDSMGNVSSTLGSNQVQVKGEMSVFPNPATDYIKISFPKSESKVNFTIYDSTGRIIYENTSYKTGNISIDVSDFTNGIYFIVVFLEEKVFRNKLIVE